MCCWKIMQKINLLKYKNLKFFMNICWINLGKSWDLYCSSLCFPIRCLRFWFTVLCCSTGKFRTNSYYLFLKKMILNKPLPSTHSSFWFHCIELCMKNKILQLFLRILDFKWNEYFFEKHEIKKEESLRFWIFFFFGK